MRFILTVFFFCILSCFAGSQNRVADSLIRLSKQPGLNDTLKIKLYGDISWELMGSDINQALAYAQKELSLSATAKRSADIAQAESDVGNIYNRKAIYDTALLHYTIAAKLRTELRQDEKAAGVYSNIAAVYIRQNKYKEALEIDFKSLRLFEQIGNIPKQVMVLGNIGFIYYELDQNKPAEEFYRKALALAKNKSLGLVEANVLVSMGGIKFEEGVVNDAVVDKINLDSALYYDLEAEQIMIKNNGVYNLGALYNNLGRIYLLKNDYEKATRFYERSLENRQLLEDKLGIGLSYINLGDVSRLKADYNSSIDFFTKSVGIFAELRNLVNLKQAYGKLSEVYEAKKDYPSAMKFHQLYAQYADSVYTTENAEQMAEMQTRYDTEKKDLQLAKNKAELETREEQAFIKNVIIVSVICLLILLCVAAYFFYRKKQVQQKAELDATLAKQKEIRSKAVIEAEEKERIRIATDLHDGVGQLLSAAKLNLSSLESKIKIETPDQALAFKNALDLVDDSVKEVRAVSHNMMPNTLLKLGLASAVKEFVLKIQNTPDLKVNLEIVGLSERLEQEKETVLYRVIQEIVSNIIKHAKASELTMQIIHHGHELSVLIEDNGVGFDTSKINDFDGIGLKNIMSRVEFINGSVHFDSVINRGTTVVIDVAI